MKFLPGFTWALPTAFSEAVALCRFEEGDSLYDSRAAYADGWEFSRYPGDCFMQVRFPARVKGGSPGKVKSVFSRNWAAEVRLDLYRSSGRVFPGQIHTTQGRLYTALWTGDLAILRGDASPPVPLGVREVTRLLSETPKEIASYASRGYPVFAMARDVNSAASRNKYNRVFSSLHDHLPEKPILMAPGDLQMRDSHKIAPTVQIAFFALNGMSAEKLREKLKDTLYAPAKDAMVDRFRLEAHGVIFDPDGAVWNQWTR